MNGRIQSEMKIEKTNDVRVKKMPSFVEGWYANMKASRKTAATCRDYLRKIHNFLEFLNKDVVNVKPSDITEEAVTNYFLSIQTKEIDGEISYTSDSYQCSIWCCMDSFLKYLHRNNLISDNFIRNIDKPKNKDLYRINENRILLNEKDFKSILNTIKSEKDDVIQKRDYALILLFMNTGLRRTAMSTVMINDFNLDERMLRVIDKGNKRHEYILNNDVIEAINEWLIVRDKLLYRINKKAKDNGYLFVSEVGNGISGDTISYTVEKYTKHAFGKSISPHKLRAGYCSILYNKTHDIEFVRRAVGHSNVSTTQRYIVTAGEEKRRAAEIMGSIL